MRALIFFLILILTAALIFFRVWSERKPTSEKTASSPLREATGTNEPSNKDIIIESPSFLDGKEIPTAFTCDGNDINPKLNLSNVPPETGSLVLTVSDPDAPAGTFHHWLVANIEGKTRTIEENSLPNGVIEGANDFGTIGYKGPCPPPGKAHRYIFEIVALKSKLTLGRGFSRSKLDKSLEGKILTRGTLTGLYGRK